LGNSGRNFGWNLNHQTNLLSSNYYNLIYKCEVAKLGSKARNFLFGKRGEKVGEIERQREREIGRERKSKT
jgi:hypothetical protein